MRFFNIILSIVFCTTLSAAWPWPPTFQNINNALARRQDNNDNTDSSSPESTAEPASTQARTTARQTASPTRTQDNSDAESATSGRASRTASGASETGSAKSGSTKTSKPKSISIDPAGAIGAIVMTEPAMTSSTYVRIGETVTFKWNYTNVVSSPSKIDVVVSATDGSGTWTISSNMTMKETGAVIWDTNDAEPSLPMQSYAFAVYDAAEGPSATPEAGKLSPYQVYQFAMYSPKEPSGTGKAYCVTCWGSGAITASERQSIKVLTLVATLTVLSFTWFATGFLGI